MPEGNEGVDLAPVMGGVMATPRDTLFTLYKDNMRAIRDARWKLIRFTKTGKTLLFDLENDPHEIDDLAGDPGELSDAAPDHPELVELLSGRLDDFLELRADGGELPALSGEDRALLESLGYLGDG